MPIAASHLSKYTQNLHHSKFYKNCNILVVIIRHLKFHSLDDYYKSKGQELPSIFVRHKYCKNLYELRRFQSNYTKVSVGEGEEAQFKEASYLYSYDLMTREMNFGTGEDQFGYEHSQDTLRGYSQLYNKEEDPYLKKKYLLCMLKLSLLWQTGGKTDQLENLHISDIVYFVDTGKMKVNCIRILNSVDVACF